MIRISLSRCLLQFVKLQVLIIWKMIIVFVCTCVIMKRKTMKFNYNYEDIRTWRKILLWNIIWNFTCLIGNTKTSTVNQSTTALITVIISWRKKIDIYFTKVIDYVRLLELTETETISLKSACFRISPRIIKRKINGH